MADYSYPDIDDPDFQKKIYEKREFYYHKADGRDEFKNYAELKEYRDKICTGKFQLREHQALVSNFLNPDTPYKGLLLYHGTGTGKTCAAIAIAEKFKSMVQRYGTKIHVLVPGPLVKENWKRELIKCTGETYISQTDIVENKEKLLKNAMNNALEYYKFISYRSFYKKVLGDKIRESVKDDDNKIKLKYVKDEEGKFKRDISIDKLNQINNTLLIIDEAHHLTGNSYGDAIKKIIKASNNLKILILSATPMKNLADDILELLNLIRPLEYQINRDKIFTSDRNYLMEIKEGGLDYFKKMANGLVSYLRGADPLTFAKRTELGVIPKGLLFTKVIQCKMMPFQQKAYDSAVIEKEESHDTLDRKSESVANLVLPSLSPDKKTLIGISGTDGINTLKNQIKLYNEILNKRIGEMLSSSSSDTDYMTISDNQKTITGNIYKLENLKHFSIKFYTAINNLNQLFDGKKGSRTAFVYSNLVRIGIEPFEEMLKVNGYLEFKENMNSYVVTGDTICYFCGKTHSSHSSSTNSSSAHDFHPATYIKITGKSVDDVVEVMAEDNKRILDNYFSIPENKTGRFIKLVIGSKVMSEAISLKNVAEVHILDVYFNLGQIDQIIGRAIRDCSHHQLITDTYREPEVLIYKYVVESGVPNKLSREEELYQKSEKKYIVIKKIERALKEVAIDCPLNINRNIFPEEVKEHKNCVEPLNVSSSSSHGPSSHGPSSHDPSSHRPSSHGPSSHTCPLLCDYTNCIYKCYSDELNKIYYDTAINKYKDVEKSKIDYTTFTKALAKNEIEYAKNKIKEMYKTEYVYTIDNILNYVKKTYPKNKINLFDDYFIYKALDTLIPVTENDFNNFKDIVTDKYNKPGYLIFINKYYIYQPFNEPEDIPMHYRITYEKKIRSNLTLANYLESSSKFKQYSNITKVKITKSINTITYDFDLEYYEKRNENEYIGIIDKETSKKKDKNEAELEDVFKLREKRSKILDKKRGIGIPTLKGSVATSKEKSYIINVANSIGIKFNEKEKKTKHIMADKIKEKMINLEKYSKGSKKLTYIMVPKNHPTIPFPLNLEDRVEYIKKQIKNKIKIDYELKVVELDNKYKIILNKKNITSFESDLKTLFGKYLTIEKDNYTILVE